MSTVGKFDGDTDALGDALEEAYTEGGDDLAAGGSLWDRLTVTEPNPDLEEVEPWRLGGWENAAKYAKRGFDKITQAGGTALEDIGMVIANAVYGFYEDGWPWEGEDDLTTDDLNEVN